MLIDDERQAARDKAAQEIEGQDGHPEVERIKTLLRNGGEESPHHTEERFEAPLEHDIHIERDEDEAVREDRHADGSKGADGKGERGALHRTVVFIDDPRGDDECDPDEQVGKLPHEHTARSLAHEADEELDDDDDTTRDRPERKGADEERNVREVVFEEAREGKREGETEDVQYPREGAEERNHHDPRCIEKGTVFSHKNTSEKNFFRIFFEKRPAFCRGARKCSFLFSSGLYRRYGNCTRSVPEGFADFTAGGDFHSAPKNIRS